MSVFCATNKVETNNVKQLFALYVIGQQIPELLWVFLPLQDTVLQMPQ